MERRSAEVDSVSRVKKSEIQPALQSTVTDSVSVRVDNPVSGSEKTTKRPFILDKYSSFLACCIPVPKPFIYLICCLLFVCFAPVAYVLLTVATVTILPLLLATFVFVRLLQITVNSKNPGKIWLFKCLLSYWIFVLGVLLLVEVGLFYPIAKYVPGLKLVLITGLPITKWITIICILVGIYVMSQFIWMSIILILGQVPSAGDEKHLVILESVSEIVGCLFFLWAEVVVMNNVPSFKQSKIFGIYTRKWIEVSLFLLIGYDIITLLTHLIVWSLPKIFRHHPGVGVKFNDVFRVVCCDVIGKVAFNEKYLVYIATGINRSIIFILSMVMLLLTWEMYFGNRLNTTPQGKRVLGFGTWTMVSILVCSFLWLIKSCLLLYWEAHSVYDRLHYKITAVGKQLYFLTMLSHTHYQRIIESQDDSNVNNSGSSCCRTPPKKKAQWVLSSTILDIFGRKSVEMKLINHLDPKVSSTFDLQEAAELFLKAQYALSKESIVNDLGHLQGNDSEKTCNDSEENNERCIQALMKIVQVKGDPYFDKDWEMLLELLPDVTKTEDITFQKVKTFMERARNSCMSLINTFISEKKVVNCLNKVMGWIIIGAIFIMWLLVTGLATTKVLILIGSPVVGASFIFGSTASSLFQGLIFVYVVHPFDVGDLCVIDNGQLLEVIRISIWSTTFSNVRNIGEKHQVIYPNSDLAIKHITNYKTDFNWNDRIEFLCSPDKKITKRLKQRIVKYLNGKKNRFAPNFHSVDILEVGDKAKIVVHVKHKLPETRGWTNFECLKAKEERRFELAIELHNLVKELESRKKLRNQQQRRN